MLKRTTIPKGSTEHVKVKTPNPIDITTGTNDDLATLIMEMMDEADSFCSSGDVDADCEPEWDTYEVENIDEATALVRDFEKQESVDCPYVEVGVELQLSAFNSYVALDRVADDLFEHLSNKFQLLKCRGGWLGRWTSAWKNVPEAIEKMSPPAREGEILMFREQRNYGESVELRFVRIRDMEKGETRPKPKAKKEPKPKAETKPKTKAKPKAKTKK